jgi:hypothetical protein
LNVVSTKPATAARQFFMHQRHVDWATRALLTKE